MADIFNNFSVIVENATISKEGLIADKGKVGVVKFVPTNNEYYLISDNVTKAPIDGVFAVASVDGFVKNIGIGTIENDKLVKKMWVSFTDNGIFFTENREGELVAMNLPINPPKQKYNLISIVGKNQFSDGIFKGTAYEIGVNRIKAGAYMLYPYVSSLPVFFVEFENTLLSAYIGSDFKELEKALFNPDHFIKDEDAWI